MTLQVSYSRYYELSKKSGEAVTVSIFKDSSTMTEQEMINDWLKTHNPQQLKPGYKGLPPKQRIRGKRGLMKTAGRRRIKSTLRFKDL